MDEQTDRDRLAPAREGGERALAEAREVLLNAREALLDERDTRAEIRDTVADARDRVTDARNDSAIQQEAADRLRRSETERREERVRELIDAADDRDREAERRDRAAEARDAAAALHAQRYPDDQRLDEKKDRDQASLDRLWAAENRDAAAGDREVLREMARSDRQDP
jgi:sulfite oxidase